MKEVQWSIAQLAAVMGLVLVTMFVGLFIWQAEPHIPLMMAMVLVAIVGIVRRVKYEQLEKAIIQSLQTSVQPVLLLSLIGIILALWMGNGSIATLFIYVAQLISPDFFLLSILVITIAVSLFTGSSFTTVSTVGVAFISVAAFFEVSLPVAAGAIICGAAFGDKMSPLSDTTTFASSIGKVTITEHIRNMLYTALPSLAITIIFFAVLDLQHEAKHSLQALEEVVKALDKTFAIGPLTLLSPFVVLVMSFRRMPIIPTLVVGIITAIATMVSQPFFNLPTLFATIQTGFAIKTGNAFADSIVNRGGLQPMMWSVSLIMIAFILSGVLEGIGVMKAMLNALLRGLRKPVQLVAAAGGSSIFVNFVTGEQYLSILLPGQSFAPAFTQQNIPGRFLSRTIEDCGTLVNPLVPWGVCAAFFAKVLGVDAIDYIPFAIYLLVSPFMTLLVSHWQLKKALKEETIAQSA